MTSMPFKSVVAAVTLGVALLSASLANAASVTVPGNYATIQAAINDVINGTLPNGTTINIQAGTYPETLVVANTARSLTVRGIGGAASTIVDAQGLGTSAVNVSNATGQVVFQGLTFRHGTPPVNGWGGGFIVQSSSPSFVGCIFELNSSGSNGGGGALISSNATFAGCTIRNNSAVHFGGGVFIYAGSRPVFTNCTITGNASGTGTSDGAGGGVFATDSSPTFKGSSIDSNNSKFAAGGIFLQGTFGSPYGRSTLLLQDSEVADNVSSQFSPTDNPAEGGGIHVEDNATATLTRARILRNKAGTGGGLNTYRGRYDVTDSVIDGNQATAANGFGGGIAATSNYASPSAPAAIVNLTGTLLRNNTALAGNGSQTGSAGGIAVIGDNFSSAKTSLSLVNSVVDSNSSSNSGGGILVSHADLTATNSLVIRNTVSASGSGFGPFGGGIAVMSNATATITGSTLAHNTATGAGGASGLGGGLFLNSASYVNMSSSNVYDNTASARGGGVFSGSSDQTGTIQTSTIADNTSQALPGQVNEDACSSLTYVNNTITPLSGSNLFAGGCSTIATRASGTNSNPPRFAHFLAVPSTGTSTTLVWSVARATSVTIAGVGTYTSPTNSPTGTVDVSVTATTSYSLTATATSPNGGNYTTPVNAGVTFVAPPPPTVLGRAVAGDFDGDGKTDITVFRPSGNAWYSLQSKTGSGVSYSWGGGSDIPVTGDYDGDGKIDVAVFRPSTGVWYILQSTAGFVQYTWGGSIDTPVPGDYDGDGKTDVAVFRPSTGAWYILRSSAGFVQYTWGGSIDTPVPGDYDGDGKTDVAVFRPSTGAWYILQSTAGFVQYTWGGSIDVPVPGDYDGDGKTDVAVFRPSTGAWYILRSSAGFVQYTWGGSIDTPIP